MTADTEEQWVKGTLPLGEEFHVENVVDLEELLPDCGYKLRSVEFEARGVMERIDCADCPGGESTLLKVTGGGATLELAGVESITDGEVFITGVVRPPFDQHLRVDVLSVGQ